MAKGKNNKSVKKQLPNKPDINSINYQNNDDKKPLKSNKIELKPCKGSITRILMDEGFKAYTNIRREKNLEYEEKQKKWCEDRKEEYYCLTERQSDFISLDVYEYILHNTTPWNSFQEFLNEDYTIRIEKMKRYGLIEKKETNEEIIYLPLSDKYITKKKVSEEYEDEYINSYYTEDKETEKELDYEWEEEYEEYDFSEDEEYSDNDY